MTSSGVVAQMAVAGMRAMTPMGKTSNATPTPTAAMNAPPWREGHVQACMRKVCGELADSLDPVAYRRQLRHIIQLESSLSGLFCFSAWIGPVVASHSDVGAYSNSITAMIYKLVAERMPRLLLVAAFGKDEVGHTLKSFLDHAIDAEGRITDHDLEMVADINPKDRGPFLYWLLNERVLQLSCITPHLQEAARRRSPHHATSRSDSDGSQSASEREHASTEAQ